MSSHPSNTRRPLQRPNNSHAWYGNNQTVMDIIHPPSSPFLPIPNESVDVDPWLWSLQDRILTLPPSIMSFPRPRMQLLVIHNNLAENSNLRPLRPMEQSRRQNSELTPDQQRKAFSQLKKVIFNPIPKKIIQRLGKFSRQEEGKGQKNDKQQVLEDDDNDKKCVICLEDFEVKEVVMVTPCNHMFHEECILPWVKSHGKCPVCRFSFVERFEDTQPSSTNNNNLASDRLTNGLIPLVTSRGNSTTIEPFWF